MTVRKVPLHEVQDTGIARVESVIYGRELIELVVTRRVFRQLRVEEMYSIIDELARLLKNLKTVFAPNQTMRDRICNRREYRGRARPLGISGQTGNKLLDFDRESPLYGRTSTIARYPPRTPKVGQNIRP